MSTVQVVLNLCYDFKKNRRNNYIGPTPKEKYNRKIELNQLTFATNVSTTLSRCNRKANHQYRNTKHVVKNILYVSSLSQPQFNYYNYYSFFFFRLGVEKTLYGIHLITEFFKAATIFVVVVIVLYSINVT